MGLSLSLFGLQWAVGSLLFLWVSTRHRAIGLGYGQITRICFVVILVLALVLSGSQDNNFRGLNAVVLVACCVPIVQSHLRRKVGVSEQTKLAEKRSARVAAMTGIDRPEVEKEEGSEFNPIVDLAAPVIGLLGLAVLGMSEGDLLGTARIVIGALFMGAVTDAMALGHWYLVQPGLERKYLQELVYWTTALWLPISVLYLLGEGMFSVFSGAIDDGYNGLLGWFWAACVVTTIGLLVMTIVSLKEKYYSAVMAATGLLYLAILTAFGIDLVARALLV